MNRDNVQNIRIITDEVLREEGRKTTMERNLANVEDDIVNDGVLVKDSAAYLKDLTDKKVNRVLNATTLPPAFMEFFKDVYNTEVDEVEADIKLCTTRIESGKNACISYGKNLKVLEKKLAGFAKTHPAKHIHINDVKMALTGFPNIDVDRTRFSYSGAHSTDPSIHMYFHSVMCKPNRQIYKNIMDEGWVLQPIQFTYRFRDGQSHFVADNPEHSLPRGYTRSTPAKPHPHVLSGNNPCWGDFLGGIVDAKNAWDFAQLATVVQLFLEQAATEDDAGQFYARWMVQSGNTDKSVSVVNNLSSWVMDNGWKVYATLHEDSRGAHMLIPFVKDGVTTWHETPHNPIEGRNTAILNMVKKLRRQK